MSKSGSVERPQDASGAPLEIERKFLVREEHRADLAKHPGARFTQGYLAYKPSVRVRLSESSGTEQAWLTIKGPGMLERAEYEYEIPVDHGRGLLKLCAATLSKTRRRVQVASHTWDVDEFSGAHAGLWLAEVELRSQDEAFERPAWLGDEVTQDPRYSNGALARAGCAP